MQNSTDSRLTDLETRVAFQEDAIDQLSDIIARQDKELSQLKRLALQLHEQLLSFRGEHELSKPEEEPLPPHY